MHVIFIKLPLLLVPSESEHILKSKSLLRLSGAYKFQNDKMITASDSTGLDLT